jgi:hypothetical protein
MNSSLARVGNLPRVFGDVACERVNHLEIRVRLIEAATDSRCKSPGFSCRFEQVQDKN